MISLSLR
ncbi:hypothetical protein ECEC1845_3387, partial [Escherichia coli EC1845]